MQPELSETPDRRVFLFKKGQSAGRKEMKWLLGGKGANLCEMARVGLNVPPGLTISTEVCEQFHDCGGALPEGLWDEIMEALKEVEEARGQKFGDVDNPLCVSIRSGAAISMPGMMDTVLNVGCNDETVKTIAAKSGERFAYDCYRRLLSMFADVVLGLPHAEFEEKIQARKEARGAKFDVELTAEDLKGLVEDYKGVFAKHNKELPQDPFEQMRMGINAVFGSWDTPRAVKYREINGITGLKGTAVNIQSMVYGNYNDNSGTGVCFTRNPATGDKKFFGEYLQNAQGEDVVAGIRTPLPIAQLQENFPKVYEELVETKDLLERYMKDMQDIEFTVQDGELFMLQTRNGKRTGQAALNIACDLVAEELIDETKAVCMVEPTHLDQLLHPQFEDPSGYKDKVFAHGLAASPGAAIGQAVFTAEDAEAAKEGGRQVILIRQETSPEDVGGMHAAEGILTCRGGMTSHAAVVARGWGKPCVCGCEALKISATDKTLKVDNDGTAIVINEGDWLSLNGSTGEVILGKQAVKKPALEGNLGTFMAWVDKYRTLGVLTNADTPEDAKIARDNGAEGIGLVRTEHMFFSSPERIAAVRRMIAAMELNAPGKDEALEELKGYQKQDFEGIFEAMDGLPVTIRLLDPPLHEFLPKEGSPLEMLCNQLAGELHITSQDVKGRLEGLGEANPMMGFRGCRLGIIHPEITAIQVAAILEAAATVGAKGVCAHPHIMVPLVGAQQELEAQAKVIRRVAKEVSAKMGAAVEYKVGTMIEIPRGALQAHKLAQTAEFFSFGTNDLTQMTFGYSRDDAESKFLPRYVKDGILAAHPFKEIDTEGVGELIKLAVERGRSTRPDIELGICGEHGGDPASVAFFHKAGLKYVSCSPLRVPIARLAAAQAAIKAAA
ncbi:unnamed protein product [Ostreobium quekettii]|uniref:Pyruvate, phosphate dikinase n=1 Tax=Ostreobium quekettii TaxID=121088 RepID=A0A8S1IKU5_9CHLO|nr:unnamed protein product [Ostreobium quekettii]